jgi:hypothetical protein
MQLMGFQYRENLFKVGNMGVQGGTIYQNVIRKDEDKVAQEWAKNMIHEILECKGSVRKPEWHHNKLIMPIMCAESGFRNVILMHAYLAMLP